MSLSVFKANVLRFMQSEPDTSDEFAEHFDVEIIKIRYLVLEKKLVKIFDKNALSKAI